MTQRPIVVKLSRGRSVGLSSALWKNGGSDPDAVWHHRLDGSRDEVGSGVWGSVHGKGYFWRRIWGLAIVTNGDFTAYIRVRQRRDAVLFPNYVGQTCCFRCVCGGVHVLSNLVMCVWHLYYCLWI